MKYELLDVALRCRRVLCAVREVLNHEDSHNFVKVEDGLLVESLPVVRLCVPNCGERRWDEMKHRHRPSKERDVVVGDARASELIHEDVRWSIRNFFQRRRSLQLVFNVAQPFVQDASVGKGADEPGVGASDEIKQHKHVLKENLAFIVNFWKF